MTPLPKKKRSLARRTNRKLAFALTNKRLAVCPNCQSPVLSHIVCTNCGFYRGREVVKFKDKTTVRKVETT